MIRFSVPLLALALALAAVAPAAARPYVSSLNFQAAECAGLGTGCPGHLARVSRVCKPWTWMTSQSWRCREAACKYCRADRSRHRLATCQRDPIVKNCFGGRRPGGGAPRPAPQAPAPAPRPGVCAWRGSNGRIYIPATSMPFRYPWVQSGRKIIWKPGGGPGIDRKGSGAICVAVVPDRSGRYYFTARTAAPMRGEHNDLWMAISSGMDWYRPSHRSFKEGKATLDYTKAYHPTANNEETYHTFTIDHNPHQFITKPLVKGQRYQVCIAGRSSRFKVFAVVLVRCPGIEACSYFSPFIKGQMANKSSSMCY